jgi:hypothetical protein
MNGCTICGYGMMFHDPKRVPDPSQSERIKKHILAEHYEYLLLQCRGDKKLLRKWVAEI